MHESSGIRGEGKQSGEEEDRGRKGNALRKGGGEGGGGGGRLHEDNPEVCVCMCSVWPTIDTLLINHDETLWAVSVHARPPVVSSALLLSSSATVNDDHLPIHFYSLLSLSLSLRLLFCESSEMPLPFAPALRSISIQTVSLIIRRVCSFDARMRIKEWQRKYICIYIYIFNKKGRERVLIFILINFVKFHVVITRPFVSPF